MSKYYIDPNTGEKFEIRKTHRIRKFVVLPLAGLFAIGIVVSAVGTGGETRAPAGGTGPPSGIAKFEAFGSGEAMVSVTTQGSAMNSVQLPSSVDLPEGYAVVSVTRSPSFESYQYGGGMDSGEVGCRIVRDGAVIDEHRASGQFAAVTCTKFR